MLLETGSLRPGSQGARRVVGTARVACERSLSRCVLRWWRGVSPCEGTGRAISSAAFEATVPPDRGPIILTPCYP